MTTQPRLERLRERLIEEAAEAAYTYRWDDSDHDWWEESEKHRAACRKAAAPVVDAVLVLLVDELWAAGYRRFIAVNALRELVGGV